MKKIEKLDLSRYPGYVSTKIRINEDTTIHILLQQIENKLNEILDRLNERK